MSNKSSKYDKNARICKYFSKTCKKLCKNAKKLQVLRLESNSLTFVLPNHPLFYNDWKKNTE